MHRMNIASLSLIAVYLIITTGCATSASSLKPDSLPDGKGAFFGHVKVLNKTEEITDTCYVEFTDSKDSRKVYTSMDKTGWIFSIAEPGETYLSFVICTVGGLIKKNVSFESRELKFAIPTKGQISYFGNVSILFDQDSSFNAAVLLGGGALAGAMAATAAKTTKPVTIENKLGDATQEYKKRYNTTADKLKVVPSVIIEPVTKPAAPK